MKCSHINNMETKPKADFYMQYTHIYQLSTLKKKKNLSLKQTLPPDGKAAKLEVLKCKTS